MRTKTQTRDKKFFGRDDAPESLELRREQGSFLYDNEGRKYIDFTSGWCVGNLGWGNEEIEEMIARMRHPTYVKPDLLYQPWTELAELLAEITPGELQKSYRATGGSEAVEAAMQIAMLYTDRPGFLSIENSYHGNTLGTLSIGASDNRKDYRNLLPHCHKLHLPLDENTLKRAELRLHSRNIAAFIMEPVSCNLGVYIPDPEFMEGMQELCRHYGTLFVSDEVACGFGRTGKLFASEHYNIEPDIMCLGKAITGGYAALGATITTHEIADAIEDRFSFYSTYGWHPHSVAAAIANIRYWKRHETKLLDNVALINKIFQDRLSRMPFRYGVSIRAAGLAIAAELADADYAEEIRESCFEKGLLIETSDSKLTFFPALNIGEEAAEKGLDILESCV